jgi:hypothetical protein
LCAAPRNEGHGTHWPVVLLWLPAGFVTPEMVCTVAEGIAPSERIYFHTWIVGEECGSNKIPGCRDAAIAYLTNSSNMGFSTSEIAIFMTAGLSTPGGEPVDLTMEGYLEGRNYSQVNGMCRPGPLLGSEAVSLTLMPGFTVHQSGGGCLGQERLGHKTDARAFVAARVTPPTPNGGMLGGEVKGCPSGLCIIGMHAPDGPIATSAADTVKQVCGKDLTPMCTVAVGDFGAGDGDASPQEPNSHSKLVAHLDQQFEELGLGKLVSTTGFAGARSATNVVDTGPAMDIGPTHPLPQFGNITGQSPSGVLDVLLPCAYPAAFEYCKK